MGYKVKSTKKLKRIQSWKDLEVGEFFVFDRDLEDGVTHRICRVINNDNHYAFSDNIINDCGSALPVTVIDVEIECFLR